MQGSFAVYRVERNATALREPLFDDPKWNEVEAVRLAPRRAPMGHISAMVPGNQTATLLCLDANFTRSVDGSNRSERNATRVRVLVADTSGLERALGEVPLHEDGSFLAEVPADQPLGFEALGDAGEVLRRLAPALWLRPGENRSCIGCHEPYNRSPRNHRPLAIGAPPVRLSGSPPVFARTSH
jgi:hypothetical protein